MRILFLAPHPFFQARGTPIAVRAVLEFLGESGHQVDLVTYHEGEDLALPNCRHYRLPAVPGLRDIRPGFSAKKVVCDALMFAKVLRMIRRTRYDLIHAVEEAAFMAAAVRKLTGIPYVYDMDSSLPEQLTEAIPVLAPAAGMLRRFERTAIRRSSGVLAVCAALEDRARAVAPDTPIARVEDTSLLPANGGPPDEELVPASIRARGPITMYVGNLEHYQGIDLLLDGFVRTAARVPAAQLVIVGGRPDDITRYRARAAELGIGDHTHFLGPRPIGQLGGLLRQAAVVVSPRLKGTNTPMKLFSYLDSGTAVLATRLPTHTQVLDDRAAALVTPDPGALGDELARLLEDAPRRADLARAAKALVQREFSPEAARRKLAAFYRTIETTTGSPGELRGGR